MTAELHGTYDFKQVSVLVGVRQIEGFEGGTSITAERDTDSFTKKVDIDGSVTRSRSNNSAGRISFTLNQYAASNGYLQTLMNLDERTGTGVVPVKIVDKNNPNTEIVVALKAWVMKPSNRVYETESGAREWVIDCADLNFLQS